MPDLLLFRPPRRQPRLLVVNADKQHLTFLTLDPWELRYAAKHEWPRTNRRLRSQAMLNVAMIRERPQAVIVPRENNKLRSLVAPVTKSLCVPLLSFSTPDDTMAQALRHLPACHCSQEVIKDPLLFQTHALARSALLNLIQTAYVKQQLPVVGADCLAPDPQGPHAPAFPRP